jgi:hypothetical protein
MLVQRADRALLLGNISDMVWRLVALEEPTVDTVAATLADYQIVKIDDLLESAVWILGRNTGRRESNCSTFIDSPGRGERVRKVW